MMKGAERRSAAQPGRFLVRALCDRDLIRVVGLIWDFSALLPDKAEVLISAEEAGLLVLESSAAAMLGGRTEMAWGTLELIVATDGLVGRIIGRPLAVDWLLNTLLWLD
jgi:hypothetical protein